MPRITIKGVASSKKIYEEELTNADLNKNLMSFLKNINLPIASSCDGNGVCKKCIVNSNILSCQTTLKELINIDGHIIIEIAYL